MTLPRQHQHCAATDHDAHLAGAWCEGDLRAANRLLRRHVPALRRYIAARVGAAADLDDIVQETLLAVLRNRRQLASRPTIRPYLFAAARAKLIDAARWRSRDDRRHAGLVDERTMQVDDADPLVIDEASASMAEILGSLPDALAVALARYFIEEQTAAEIGEELGLPQGTVRTRVRRALQLVRARVDAGVVTHPSISGVVRWSQHIRAR